jgi:hypothetical protein
VNLSAVVIAAATGAAVYGLANGEWAAVTTGAIIGALIAVVWSKERRARGR